MSRLQQPVVNIYTTEVEKAARPEDPRVLIIGPVHKDTTENLNQVVKDVDWNSIEDMYGLQSILTHAVKKFKSINEITQVDVIAIKEIDNANNKGTVAQLVLSGTAEESKNITIRPFDDMFSKVIPISKGDNASTIAGKIVLLDNDQTYKESIPFSVAINGSNANTVDFTMLNRGSYLDGLNIRVEGKIRGVTITTIRSAGGSGGYNETAFSSLDVMENLIQDRYHSIVFDQSINKERIKAFLEKRFDIENGLDMGVGFTSVSNNIASLKTDYATENTRVLVTYPFLTGNDSKYWDFNYIPLMFLSEIVAIRSLRLTQGANISKYVINSSLNSVGGPDKATLPYHRTPLSYLNSTSGSEMSLADAKSLNKLGYSIINNEPNGRVCLGSVVLPYRLNSKGQEDLTYHYLNAVDASMIAKEYIYRNFKSDFAQAMFSKGIANPNTTTYTEPEIIGTLLRYYDALANMNIFLSGDEYKTQFENSIRISFDDSTGTLTINCEGTLLNQIRNLVVYIGFSL